MHQNANRSNWRAGYAERDITPGPGHTLMAGFGYERYASGAIAPLRAQALAISDLPAARGSRVLLLAADVLSFDPVFVESIRRALARRHALAPGSILLAPSHTHWGPAIGYRVNFDVGAPDVWYRHALERTFLELADEAIASLAPAALSYTEAQAKIGLNRRLPRPDGAAEAGPNPLGFYDTHTPILSIERRGDPARILLVTHACHPTSSGRTPKWSPDYPGALRDRVERTVAGETKRGARVIFAMGCGGDAKVCHRDDRGRWVFSAKPVESRAAGRALGEAVLKHLAAATPSTLSGRLSCRVVRGSLSFARPLNRRQLEELAFASDTPTLDSNWARQSLAFPDRRRRLRYEAQAWRFGEDLTLLSLSGEVCAPLGPMARALARTREAMIVAYTNATEAYIPTAQIVREGGYEGNTSHRAYFLPAPFLPRVETEFLAIVKRAVAGAVRARRTRRSTLRA